MKVNGHDVKMATRDVIWTIVLIVSVVVAYATLGATVKTHVGDQNIHLQREDVERMSRMEAQLEAINKNLERVLNEKVNEKQED